jgi:hypothetical protein
MDKPLYIEKSWDIELDAPYASFTCPLEWLIRGRDIVIFALGRGEVITYAHRSEEQTTRVTVELFEQARSNHGTRLLDSVAGWRPISETYGTPYGALFAPIFCQVSRLC